MRKLYIFGLLALACIIIGIAWAEQMTFTTYYPAPHGVYNNMVVMNNLGVGTSQPEGKLDVRDGIVFVESIVIRKRADDPLSPKEGEIWLISAP